ncbi:type II secretion system protein [Deferribacter thermophilus]|uniref:type IV pilus modification PilV family protein n=1 Tax=Deferribacter thermophilus TaxID=53573 RepID=UPI003C270293
MVVVAVLQNKKGFTLIEMMVSLFIFSVALLGLVASMITVKKMNMRNNVRNIAIEQVNNEIEKLRAYGFNKIDNLIGSCENIECSPANDNCSMKAQYRNTWISIGKSFTVNTSGTTKEIVITSCWELFGKKYTYTTQTYIAKDIQ